MALSSNLPESMRFTFDSIESEVIWLHGRWIIYRQLYGTSIDQLEKEGKYPELVKSLESKLAVLKTQCKPFHEWRNRRIAHSDLLTALSLHPDPLPGISRSSIEHALHLVREFMNEYATHFGANYMGYEHFCMTADGEILISLLEQFWKYREAELSSWYELANSTNIQRTS